MKKVILISLDALSETEFDRLKKLKNFKKFIENGVYSKNSISVYPTQTYTVHTSVITGNYPDKHGVYNNQFFQPFVDSRDKQWFWYRHQVKTNTLYDVIKRHGGEVSSILWPVTGKSSIKYNIPEIVAIKNENQSLKVLRNSSFIFTLRCEIKYGNVRKGIVQPQLDEFAKTCALDTIRRHSPELVMLHLVSIDTAKHNYGVESPKIDDTLKELDRMIGEILDACKDEYTYIMFSDHGQFTVEKEVYLNVFLEQNKLVDFAKEKYKAYIECMGGSAIIRSSDNNSLEDAVRLLKDNKEMLGIEDIYARDVLDEMHIDKDIDYIIEAKAGYHFKDGKYGEVIRTLKDENIIHATHGYSPLKKGYGCVFFAMGEGIKSGVEIDKMEVVDIAPTIAKIMGIDEYNCDGKVLENIFE